MLPDQIDDAPTPVSLLDMRKRERRNFGSPQSAAEKNGKNGAIAHAANRRDVGRAQERLRLPLRQPVPEVPDADAGRFDALQPADPLGQLRRE
jgi:hypothetical protein